MQAGTSGLSCLSFSPGPLRHGLAGLWARVDKSVGRAPQGPGVGSPSFWMESGAPLTPRWLVGGCAGKGAVRSEVHEPWVSRPPCQDFSDLVLKVIEAPKRALSGFGWTS